MLLNLEISYFKTSKQHLTAQKLHHNFSILFLQKPKVNFLRNINKQTQIHTKNKNSTVLSESITLFKNVVFIICISLIKISIYRMSYGCVNIKSKISSMYA